MDLPDLLPKPSRFHLRLVNRWFTTRPITLEDEIWISDTFGDDIKDIFETVNMKEISRIAFNQLEIEDKKFFKKQEVEFVSEEGEETHKTIGGVELFNSLVSGIEEKNGIIQALLDTIGASRPPSDDKKKA